MYLHNNLRYRIVNVTATTTATALNILIAAETLASPLPLGHPIRVVLRCAGAALTLTDNLTADTFVLAANVEKAIDADILDQIRISVAAATQAVSVEIYYEP